jgi:hypothetical protein
VGWVRALGGFLGGFFDLADVHERRLGQVTPFALTQLLERTNRLIE